MFLTVMVLAGAGDSEKAEGHEDAGEGERESMVKGTLLPFEGRKQLL